MAARLWDQLRLALRVHGGVPDVVRLYGSLPDDIVRDGGGRLSERACHLEMGLEMPPGPGEPGETVVVWELPASLMAELPTGDAGLWRPVQVITHGPLADDGSLRVIVAAQMLNRLPIVGAYRWGGDGWVDSQPPAPSRSAQ